MSNDWNGGYKKPPAKNRFKPGQSGNAKGRPPRLPADQNDPLDIIMRVLTQPITIAVNNRSRRVPAIEALAQRLARKVASGQSRSLVAWELLDHFYAWENQHVPSGQMDIVYVDWNGNVLSERPPPPGSTEN